MIGREAELAHLCDLVALVAGGDSRVVVVQGEAGIGKSTVVAAVAGTARAAGFLVLTAEGFEGDLAVGFAALHQLLHPVLDRADDLPDRHRSALLTAFGLHDGPSPDQSSLSLAVLGLLEDAALQQPVVVLVEDAHWVDPSTAGVLAVLARRLGRTRVLLLATIRDSGGLTAGSLHPATRVPLSPLSEADSGRLLDSLGHDLPPATRRHVLREAAGNPLAIREFAAAVAADGLVDVAPVAGRLPSTRRLEAVFRGLVDHLPSSARRLLLLASADDDLSTAELTAAAASLGSDPADLELVTAADLLRTVEGRVRFRHALLRSAVYGSATSSEQTEVHAVLAATLEDPDRTVWHRVAAHEDGDDLAADLEATARRAASRGAHGAAAVALRRSASLTSDRSARFGRLLRAADHFRQVGDVVAAEDALRSADRADEDPAHGLMWLQAMSLLELSSREPRLGVSDFLDQLRTRGEPRTAADFTARTTLLVTAAIRTVSYPSTEHERRELTDRLNAVSAPVRTDHVDLALALVDPAGHVAVRSELPSLLEKHRQDGPVLQAIALTAERLQDLDLARSAWRAAVDVFRREHRVGDETTAVSRLLGQLLLHGELQEGLAQAQTAYRLAVDLRLPMIAATSAGWESRFLVWLGRLDEAEEALARCHAEDIGPRTLVAVSGAAWAAGAIALQRQRFAEARGHLTSVRTYEVFGQWTVADLAEAGSRDGGNSSDRPWIEEVARRADVLGAAHLRMLAHRGLALLSDGDAAEGHFRTALAAGERASTPLEVARTHLLFGERLRRERRAVEAREHLTRALDEFERRGARGFASRAATELSAAGGTAERTVQAVAHPLLTGQERQIARLAAEGLTNRNIAERLHLSHRTVGAHLYKLFPKLGITDRRQLPEALRREESTP